MKKKDKKRLLRIGLAAAAMILLEVLPIEGIFLAVLYLIPYLIVGYDVLWKAVKGIGNGQLLDENFLMALATLGAFALGLLQTGDYVEAVAVMLLFQLGELFQSYAVGKSRRNIRNLMNIRPEFARVEEDGAVSQVDPEEVNVGSVILVYPGERIPLDGVILEGESALNTAALTGESMPRDVAAGDDCISGCINLSGVLRIRTTKTYQDSTVARILELVENAGSHKSRSERFISRFSSMYTPTVCLSAVLLAVLPPLLDGQWLTWLYRGLAFLVASCPCALVISIPLTFFAGIGGASKAGILMKGANYLEALSKTKTVVMDKTGTLTKGEFSVTEIHSVNMSRAELLRYAAVAEQASSHPISKSLQKAYGKMEEPEKAENIREYSGYGVTAVIDGKSVAVGSFRLLEQLGISYTLCARSGTVVYAAVDHVFAGYIVIEDALKETAFQAIRGLKKSGVKHCIMLTGDHPAAARQVADKLGIDRVHSGLLPQDKVACLESILQEKPKGSVVAFVGDGINDAPVLTRADIGIAMGAMGADAAIEAADVVLMDDDPEKIVKAISISRKCMVIVYENIVMAIGIKLGALLLVALGVAGMGVAIFADVGVMILAVFNAIRALLMK